MKLTFKNFMELLRMSGKLVGPQFTAIYDNSGTDYMYRLKICGTWVFTDDEKELKDFFCKHL